jgi:hypothetical protein
MSNQIKMDREFLMDIVNGLEHGKNHFTPFLPQTLRAIASRLGKLDGWEEWDPEIHMCCDTTVLDCERGSFAIRSYDLMQTLPDEPKPETPVQKYERITGEKAYYWSKLLGEEMPKLDYIAWLEADKPDDWPRRK